MSTMQAVVYHGPKDIRVETVAKPECGPGELGIAVDACAVCGTDLKTYLHGNPRIAPPKVMGHEFTGLVDAIGEGVTGFTQGDRIVMATSISCGDCAYCKRNLAEIEAEFEARANEPEPCPVCGAAIDTTATHGACMQCGN